jgi:hypothetical protein
MSPRQQSAVPSEKGDFRRREEALKPAMKVVPIAPATPKAEHFMAPEPPFRRLRGFAIDPSLETQLDTAAYSQVTFKVPWEPLGPGPLGEYLEVIDIDPGSKCFYEPVDLDSPKLLAQEGLPPSEGTPQFHQQMVYAVSSLTIQHFERSLGRLVLFRPGPSPNPRQPKDDSVFVPRLRIYPHALREQNAYYSPEKIALLFGYFNATEDEPGDHLPGGMVFTCLSHDVVAHETTHALLDGMHRRFLNSTNPDVLAFHEAFADMVALFQHFTFPEIVRQQIASTRGEIRSQQNLLGELAGQFGRSTGLRGALRSAIGQVDEKGKWVPREARPSDYAETMEPHLRGAVLVAAVFDAFLSIYERRTADLLRLATGGTGVLQPGAVHPDLVDRLAGEAAKSAQHVLTMCIRALDYCPPVDITFGEYLRAIITADADLVADDDLQYRVAFIEAFRKRGIYPLDVRTLSVESLLWRGPQNDERRPSERLEKLFEFARPYAQDDLYAESPVRGVGSRRKVFDSQRDLRRKLQPRLKKHLQQTPGDAAFLGMDPKRPFEVHTARFAMRTRPDGGVDPQIILGLLQQNTVPVDPSDPNGETMALEGGCSIVADLRQLRIRYCIRKSLTSAARLGRQRQFAMAGLETLRATYFGAGVPREPFAALHRGV